MAKRGSAMQAPGTLPGDPARGEALLFRAACAAHRERTTLGTFGAASEGRRIDPADLPPEELTRLLGEKPRP